jgi:hypothetical protein
LRSQETIDGLRPLIELLLADRVTREILGKL